MRLFLPIVCLIAVLLVNVITTPGFFKVSINNGVLYGYIVDVINRASELVILAVGMTLVTAASGGQDISVGAVMAVAAAVCCQILSGGEVSVNTLAATIIVAMLSALAASALSVAFNGFLVAKLNIQPMVATLILYTAGRGMYAVCIRYGKERNECLHGSCHRTSDRTPFWYRSGIPGILS